MVKIKLFYVGNFSGEGPNVTFNAITWKELEQLCKDEKGSPLPSDKNIRSKIELPEAEAIELAGMMGLQTRFSKWITRVG